jgi:hypothetical protein
VEDKYEDNQERCIQHDQDEPVGWHGGGRRVTRFATIGVFGGIGIHWRC